MLNCMRTTLNLPDGLVAEVKSYADRTGRTFTSVLAEAVRLLLATEPAVEPGAAEPLPAFGEPHGRFLVDLSDRDAVWTALDAGRAR